MGTTLSDIIDVTVYQDLPQLNGPELTTFVQSGIVTQSGMFNELANSPGKKQELPFWNDLDGSIEVNYSNDAPGDVATPLGISQGEQIAQKAFVNQGWQTADLVNEIAMGATAMEAIRNKTSMYFQRQFQRRLVASTNGIVADNIANDAGDMVVDVASESIAGQSAATLFNADAFTDAFYTAGDNAASMFTAIAVHSQVMSQMSKNDDIVYIPNSEGQLVIPTYKGLRVIVDDGLTVTPGSTDGFKYTSVIYGTGAFAYGSGMPSVPVEVEREAAQGNGGGIETLWERNTWILHPSGFAVAGTPSDLSYTLTDLNAATSWDRVVDRQNVAMAFLISN